MTAHTDYLKTYQRSIDDSETFWREQALEHLHWQAPFSKVKQAEFKPPFHFEWFLDGKLNVAENCIDRHLAEKANQPAIIWENDAMTEKRIITYQELHDEVNAFSALLLDRHVQAGDVVTLYMPMIPEAVFAMMACARIGAIHSVVFGGFSGAALAERMQDAQSKVLITASQSIRGGKAIAFKPLLDAALEQYTDIDTMIIVDRPKTLCQHYESALDYDEVIERYRDTKVDAQAFPSEHPLFILYTSGSTGKPKGLLHTSAGYLLYTACTFKHLFNYQAPDIHWCTADIGWITGHSYVVYGPLANGATIYIYEGVPNQPHERIWNIIESNHIHSLYTAPTLIRSLMKETPHLDQYNLSSLNILGTVGEPINPEAWQWYFDEVGQGQRPIIDTWWQTETGGVLISPISNCSERPKPGMARQPFYGIEPVIIDEQQNKITTPESKGALCIAKPWPGQARTIFGDHERFVSTYYSDYPGYYFSGDAGSFDEDQEFYVAGRMDDVINVSGHRLSTAEIESALVEHPSVCEAAVIGKDDPYKGQIVYAFVIAHHHVEVTPELKQALVDSVRSKIGAIAKPAVLHIVSNLPKTRSGKIMRRILKKIAHDKADQLGDTSTLTNPEIIQELTQMHASTKEAVA